MGNGTSIHLHVPSVVKSGSTVTGVVAVVATKPQPASQLCLRFRCDEYIKFPISSDTTTVKNFYGKSPHLELANFPQGVVQPGQYTFPFELTLSNIPATFVFEAGEHHKASILSSLEAFVVSKGKEVSLANETVFVLPNLNDFKHFHIDNNYVATSGHCCWKRNKEGSVNLKVSINKAIYSAGERVQVQINFINTTDVFVKSLEVSVGRIVEYSDGNFVKTNLTYLDLKTIENTFDGQVVTLQLPDAEIGPHSYGTYCKKFFAVLVASINPGLDILAKLPIYIQPNLRLPVDKRHPKPLSWNPIEAELKKIAVPQFQAYTDMLPSRDNFPGLLKSYTY